jgi:biopolymer transport protein ExbD
VGRKKHFDLESRFHSDPQFNMTPMIDVVFLLIIFFMLICQFISQENYKLDVPDDCTGAIVTNQLDRSAITVSVFTAPGDTRPSLDSDRGGVRYAVRSRLFDPGIDVYRNDNRKLLADMAKCIAEQAKNKAEPLVYLRADRDMAYSEVQNALIALGQAGITHLQLAAFRNEQGQTVLP